MNTLTRLIVALVLCAAGSIAFAAPPPPCTNDTDCINPQCGGLVCQWSTTGHNCVAAGTAPQGSDGWCTTDANCKCMAQGATCNTTVHHCTFTLVPGDMGLASDLATAGSTDLATSSTPDLATPTGSTDLAIQSPAPDLATAPSGGSSGCSVSGLPPASVFWPMLALLFLATRLRRRRS